MKRLAFGVLPGLVASLSVAADFDFARTCGPMRDIGEDGGACVVVDVASVFRGQGADVADPASYSLAEVDACLAARVAAGQTPSVRLVLPSRDVDSFVVAYGVVATRLKARFPQLKIGGYGGRGFSSAFAPCATDGNARLLPPVVVEATNFLFAASKAGWPLDFFDFRLSSDLRENLRVCENMDALLTSYGFLRNKTERVCDVRGAMPGAACDEAAQLIGFQQGPVDRAHVSSSCEVVQAFGVLKKLGVEIELPAMPDGIYALAATDEKGHAALMLANLGDRPWECPYGFGGWKLVTARVADGSASLGDGRWNGVVDPKSLWLLTFESDGFVSKDETVEIQRRIDACSAAGGGRVSIAPGEHHIGGLWLKSGVELHLEKGAKLIGSRNPDHYRLDLSGFDLPPAVVKRRQNALIKMIGGRDIAITGEAGSEICGRNCYDPQGEEGYRGPHLIYAYAVTNLVFSGYTARDAGNFSSYSYRCVNVRANRVSVFGGHDGFDFFACENVRAEDCRVFSGDDCFAGHGNRNLVVRNCEVNSSCSLFRLGGNDVRIEGCSGAAPARSPHRWSLSWREKRQETPPEGVGRRNTISVMTYFSGRNVSRPAGGIVFRDCRFAGVDKLFHYNFSGNEPWQVGQGLTDITFENVRADGLKHPLVAYSVPELSFQMTMKDCRFSFCEAVPEFMRGAYIDKLDFKDVSAKGVTGPALLNWEKRKPVLRFKKVEGIRARVEESADEFTCDPI